MEDSVPEGAVPGDATERPLSRRERAAVIARIEALMEYWGITLDDLESAAPLAPQPAGTVPVKYRHPVSGDTWDGIGPHPEWLRRALLKEGLRVEELKPPSGTLQAEPDGNRSEV